MKISIVTVCLNCVNTIEHTIQSVLSQTHPDIEYIVVDGRSIDNTLDTINKYKNQIAQIISEPDDGIYHAMNKGIKLVTGDIVGFLNAGDFYADQDIVSKMVEFIQSNNLDAAYGDVVYIKQDNVNQVVRFWKTGKYIKGSFRHGWAIPHPAFFCRRKYFEQYGYFESGFKIAADFELMLRLMEKYNIKTGYLPEVIVKMRTGGKANVLRGIIRGNREIIRSFRLNNLKLSPSFFICKPIIKVLQLFRRPS